MSRCGSLTGLWGNCFTDRVHRLTHRVTRRWSSTSRCGNGRHTGRTGLTGYSQVKFHEQVRQRPPHWVDNRQKEPQKSEHSFCTPGRYCAQPGRSPTSSVRGGRGRGGLENYLLVFPSLQKWFDPSILRHSEIWGAADEAVWIKQNIKIPL